MKVLLLSRYGYLGASSRVRSYQYLPFFKSYGIDVKVAPLFDDTYIENLYSGKLSMWRIFSFYITRIAAMIRTTQFDLIWLEKEMLPWLPSWFELGLFSKNLLMVVDYDDAIFHRYDHHNFFLIRLLLRKKIDAVMRRANLVIVGNDYLGDRAKHAGAQHIEVLPSVVDVTRYKIANNSATNNPLTIGWIGSPSTAKFLHIIGPALKEIVSTNNVYVTAIGANQDQLDGLPINIKPWSEENEVAEIQKFDIGIMPLADGPFERGKCGYKLIQYMACGIPVIASPVGVNKKIVEHGVNGFLAKDIEEWIDALDKMLSSPWKVKEMGKMGRLKVEKEYSLEKTAPRLAELFITMLQ
jgi:glycosyltransferase involved in cell wall biosynthesis